MNRLWTGLTILSIAGIGLFGWMLRKLLKQLQTKKEGYQPPQMRFRYTHKEVEAECQELEENGCIVLQRFDWLFVPMLFYVGMALAVVTRNIAQYPWMAWAMYGLGSLACLIGMAESVLLVGQKTFAKAASACSLAKWICFGIWVVLMFAGLFIRSTAL